MADKKVADENIILQYFDVFRKQGQYCDIVIIVNEERFRCHRFVLAATSGFFNLFFNSSFPDSTASEIEPLKDVTDAGIFRLILQYMYTGKIDITLQNVYFLLKTSDFLVMKELKNHCVQFIEQNPKVEHTLKICHLALTPISDSEFAKVAIKNARKNFEQVTQNDEFLTIDFELLESILKEKPEKEPDSRTHCGSRQMQRTTPNGVPSWYCSQCGHYITITKDVEISFAKLADWIMYDVIDRIKYFPKLANYANLNSEYINHWENLISKYTSELDLSTLVDSVVKQSFFIFTMTESNHVAIFNWSYADNNWFLYEKFESLIGNLKTLIMRDEQYLLTSASVEDGITTQFWTIQEGERTELQSPPVFGQKYSVACIDNSIFLYMCDENLIRNYETLSCADLKTEAGSKNNIYAYMLDLQKWLSIPPIPKFLFNSYFVAANHLLFVIGGTTTYSTDCGTEQKIMQFYDPRTKKWSEKSFDVDLTLKGAACGFQNKIFICEEMKTKRSSKTRTIYIYDVISEQWTLEGVKQNAVSIQLLVPFNNRLWAIPNNAAHKVEVYDLNMKTWSEVSNLPLSVKINEVDCEIVQVLDGIVY